MVKITKKSPQYLLNTPLLDDDLLAHPFDQFRSWLQRAIDDVGPQAYQMVLATAGANYGVRQRVVLLKEYAPDYYVFYTNYNSQKALDINQNSAVSLLFWWPHSQRQVRIEGVAKKSSTEDSAEYFATRPRASQLAAWASHQSQVLASRKDLVDQYDAIEKRFSGQTVPCPEFWGGYQVAPTAYEFWQGSDNRLHDRIRYTQEDSGWVLKRLAP